MTDAFERWGDDAPESYRRAAPLYQQDAPNDDQLARMMVALEVSASTVSVQTAASARSLVWYSAGAASLLAGLALWLSLRGAPEPAHTVLVQAPAPPRMEAATPPATVDLVPPARLPSSEAAAKSARRVRTLPRAPSAPSAPRASSDPLAELALLGRARRVLHADAQRALTLTDEHLASYAQGQFAEERELLAIEALSLLSRTREANVRAAAFARRYPHSVHARRLTEILHTPTR